MYASPQAVIDEVEAQVCRDFVQRGNRLMPLKQADVDSAVTKAVAQFEAIAHCEKDRSQRLQAKVSKDNAYFDHVQVSKDLLDAINARRSSSMKKE